MLIVAGYVQLAPGEIEKALPAVRKMVEASRQEEDCIQYSFARDLTDENVVRLFEVWASREALDKHFAMPHMAEFNNTLADIKSEIISIKTYDVSNVEPLMGE